MKFLKGLGTCVVMLVSGVAVYLYVTDDDVKTHVDRAIDSVCTAACSIKDRVVAGFSGHGNADPVKENQMWVEEQWEALGI